MSNAWDDADNETQEVFWESRVSMLFHYRFFQRFVREKKIGPIYRAIESVDICSYHGWKSVLNMPKNMLCLILGLFTFGVCWPTSLREKILSTGMEFEEMENDDKSEDK